MHFFAFPFAVFMNLSFDVSVREDLWVESHYAMYLCALAIPFFALGCRAAKWPGDKKLLNTERTTRAASILTWAMVFPAVFILYSAGLYYHGAEGDYNFEATWMLNMLSYMIMISYVGVLLQLRRYLQTKKFIDIVLCFLLAFGVMLVFLPSGGRQSVIQFIPFLMAYYLSEQSGFGINRIFMIVIVSVFIVLVVAVVGLNRGKYRDAEISTRLDAYAETMGDIGQQREEAQETVAGRFSDYAPVGRIVAVFPDVFPYRFFEEMDQWWQVILPGFVRKTMGTDAYSFTAGTQLTEKIGVSGGAGGTTGTTLPGDLYSRFGWFGMIIGMFLIGFLIQKVENRFFNKSLFGSLFFMIGGIRFLFLSSLFSVFLALTKDLAIILIICYILSRILPRERVGT